MIDTVSHERVAQRPGSHPYGVEVGDLVHYWPGNPQPLSEDYVAPTCQHALVVRFDWTERSAWTATLAIVDPITELDGVLTVVPVVPLVESFAQVGQHGGLSDRSYGMPASWHKDITHPATER